MNGELFVEGVALWTPRLPGWDAARPVLRGGAAAPAGEARRPDPVVLPPAERRRCPDSVAIALSVALSACLSAQRDPATLPCVFASTYGDLAITDYLCATLAADPTQLSPTKFHNSVHNAAAGYWTIATGCMQPYTALAAGEQTFTAALLSAAAQSITDATAVLLVVYDIAACGPLATVAKSCGTLGAALVLAPQRAAHSMARLSLRLQAEGATTPARAANAALVAGNAMGGCLPLFEALADAVPRTLAFESEAGGLLVADVTPVALLGRTA